MNKKTVLLLWTSILCLLLTGCRQGVISVSTDGLERNISSLTVPENIKIVGLGEASHGVREYQQMKAEVFMALVTNHHCNTFIIEGDFGGALKVEQYIHGGEGTAREAAQEIGFAIYRTQEMVDFIEWMRQYNEAAPEGEDLHFYGMDMQRYDNNKEYLLKVLEAGAPELSQRYETAFASLTDENRLTLDQATLLQGEQDALACIEAMDQQRAEIVKVVGEEAFAFARECAQSIYQCTKLLMGNTDYNTKRDGYMAEKIDWFVERSHGKMMLISGHNGHIGKVSASGYPCLGELLNEKYGENYFAIGTDAIMTSFNSQQENGFTVMKVKNTNDLTRLTEGAANAYYYVDFAKVGEGEDWQHILTKPQRMTALNVGISKWQQKLPFLFTQRITPQTTYNGVILFREVTPSTLLPKG